jgi:hypothetical protein
MWTAPWCASNGLGTGGIRPRSTFRIEGHHRLVRVLQRDLLVRGDQWETSDQMLPQGQGAAATVWNPLPFLMSLLTQQDAASRHFRQNIRSYNNIMQFASSSITVRDRSPHLQSVVAFVAVHPNHHRSGLDASGETCHITAHTYHRLLLHRVHACHITAQHTYHRVILHVHGFLDSASTACMPHHRAYISPSAFPSGACMPHYRASYVSPSGACMSTGSLIVHPPRACHITAHTYHRLLLHRVHRVQRVHMFFGDIQCTADNG